MTRSDDFGVELNHFSLARLLDETLLHLAVLQQNASMGPMHAWRARCVALMQEVDEDLMALPLTPEQAMKLRLSHALLLDEATLASCEYSARQAWQDAPLCVVELKQPDAEAAVLADVASLSAHRGGAAAWRYWYLRLLGAGLMRHRADAARYRRRLDEGLRQMWLSTLDEASDCE
ncbi:DotU family type IV/VI secretion system protein [Achromobacter spanius]|uniref:DotU family type IV/VI secretion system protein n=1 Tax=Achromobacter spanius TaxID=217203 RepID=UPI003827FEF0